MVLPKYHEPKFKVFWKLFFLEFKYCQETVFNWHLSLIFFPKFTASYLFALNVHGCPFSFLIYLSHTYFLWKQVVLYLFNLVPLSYIKVTMQYILWLLDLFITDNGTKQYPILWMYYYTTFNNSSILSIYILNILLLKWNHKKYLGTFMLGVHLHYRFLEVELIGQTLNMYSILLIIAKFPLGGCYCYSCPSCSS